MFVLIKLTLFVREKMRADRIFIFFLVKVTISMMGDKLNNLLLNLSPLLYYTTQVLISLSVLVTSLKNL